MRVTRVLIGLLLLGIAVLYAGLVASQAPSMFWSPDEGGKYLQMRALEPEYRGPPARLPYGGYDRDPDYEYYPPGTVYPRFTEEGRFVTGWSPLFPWLAGGCYRLAGPAGLYILPVLGTLLICWSTLRLVPQGDSARILALLWVALASPILFYGVLFWEHNLAVGLALSGLAWFRARPTVAVGLASLLLALAGVVMRPELVLLLTALPLAWGGACAMAWLKSNWKPVALMVVVLVVTAGVLVVRTGGHSWLVKVEDLFFLAKQEGAGLHTGLSLPVLRDLVVNNPAEFGLTLAPQAELAMGAGLLLVLVSTLGPSSRRLVFFAVGTMLLASVTCWAAMRPERYRALHALLLPAPWWAFALWLVRDAGADPAARGWPRLLAWLAGLFWLASFLTGMWHGGPEWGSRYLLVFYPLAAVGVVAGWTCAWRRYPQRFARVLLAGLLAFTTVAAVLMMNRGLREIRRTKSDLAQFEDVIRRTGTPVVTDLWWLPAALPAVFETRALYVVQDGDHLARWLRRAGHPFPEFTYLSYSSDLVTGLRAQRPVLILREEVVRGLGVWHLRAMGAP